MTWKTQSKFRQRAQRAWGWRHHDDAAFPQLQNGSQSTIMIHYPRAAACLFTRLRAEESKDGGTMMSLPTTTKWQQRAPS